METGTDDVDEPDDVLVERPGCGAQNVMQKGQIGVCEYCLSKISE